MLKKMAVIGLTAGALFLAAPTTATAASFEIPDPSPNTYAETPRVSVGDPIIDTCEASTITFSAGYFLPGERVGVSVSGLNAAAARISGDVAGDDGSLVVSFRPPSDGEGTYSLTFAGGARTGGSTAGGSASSTLTASAGYTATITVVGSGGLGSDCEQDPGPAPSGTELPLTGSTDSTGSGMELALTGGSLSPWIIGGGALALTAGGVLIAAGAARRRRI